MSRNHRPVSDFKLGDQDVAKLHAEINQIVTLRTWIALATPPIFLLMVKDMIVFIKYQSTAEIFGDQLKLILVAAVSWGLFQIGKRLFDRLRVYTVYLHITKNSIWEEHWRHFRVALQSSRGMSSSVARARNAIKLKAVIADLQGFAILFYVLCFALFILLAVITYRAGGFYVESKTPIPAIKTVILSLTGLFAITLIGFIAERIRKSCKDTLGYESDLTEAWLEALQIDRRTVGEGSGQNDLDDKSGVRASLPDNYGAPHH